MCNFCDPNLVTVYFYELTHFLDWMNNNNNNNTHLYSAFLLVIQSALQSVNT